MPWHIETDSEFCNGFAVVKDTNGELEGCHKTEQQAKDQLAALYISEEEDSEAEDEMRKGTGPAAIIVDIDGTLQLPSGINNQLIQYLNARDEIKIVVTARNETQRESTTKFLDAIDLDYRGLRMSSGGDVNTYKEGVAKSLMENHDIVLAVDNNPATRKTYEDLGIPTMAPTSRRDEAQAILAQLRTVD
jgi:hypothetical protein